MGKVEHNLTFEPDSKQIRFIELYLDYEKNLTFKDIAEKIGCSRTTIWSWFQNKDFVNWLNSKKDETIDKGLMAIYKTAIRKAQAGDFQFAKLILEIKGDYVPKSESKVTLEKDELENLTMEELIKEFEYDLNIYRTNQSGTDGKESKKAKEG